MNKDCARAEILAGAVALGEASDGERDEYRRHIAACSSCLRELGGERQIERVMQTVADAKETEVWSPAPMPIGRRHARRVRFAWTAGASTAALAVIASLGLHALVVTRAQPIVVADAPQDVAAVPMRITLDRRPLVHAQQLKPKTAPEPGIVVVHNVITLRQNDRPEVKTPVHTTETVVARSAQAPAPAPRGSNVPVWRRGHALPVAAPAPVDVARAQTAQAPLLVGRAESIAVAPSYIVRDVTPIGGDTAINPRPAPIAYAMGAEGTTAFEVSVDERGAPVKCTITKSSGYLVLDNAVCKAAMQARYSPRTINGHPTTGVYRDAFTFRASSNSEGIQ